MADRTLSYVIDGEPVSVTLDAASDLSCGRDEVLSSARTDPAASLAWYPEGYGIERLFGEGEFDRVRSGVRRAVARILSDRGIDMGDAPLDQYHRHVDDGVHQEVVARTRDLFAADFDLDIGEMHRRLGEALGFGVSDIYGPTGERVHIIVRINRPGSGDFNPVHKDIYEDFDHAGILPRMINFWIPICGVGPDTSLPVAPGSHLVPESEVLRTRAGSVVGGRRYRVNTVASWAGRSELTRAPVSDGEVLVFSSYLVHGLGTNPRRDATRVALEFRLFEAA